MAKEKLASRVTTWKEDGRLTERCLCQFWCVSSLTLRRWRQEGFGPDYLKIGGRVLYRVKDVLDFENKHHYRSPSQRIMDND